MVPPLTLPRVARVPEETAARLCGVDFFEYLTDVINRVAAMGPKATADTCRDLLPDKWEKKL